MPIEPSELFSSNYIEARARFREAATRVGAAIETLQINADADLTIDAAIAGSADKPAVIVTCGVHGVEGFFGSAAQLAILEKMLRNSSKLGAVRLILIHAVNPFGFAMVRRVNEDNVDLNRNGLLPGEEYAGVSDAYRSLDTFLNPVDTPRFRWLFPLQMLFQIRRAGGMAAFKSAVTPGQYELPRGLFFGGTAAAKSTDAMATAMPSWVAQSPRIVHLDLHSGLGAFGKVTLLTGETGRGAKWIADAFDGETIESLAEGAVTSYAARGLFPSLLQHQCGAHRYRWLAPEFGTYSPIRVLAALRLENHAYHHTPPDSKLRARATRELLECFCPDDVRWRAAVVHKTITLVERASCASVDGL